MLNHFMECINKDQWGDFFELFDVKYNILTKGGGV